MDIRINRESGVPLRLQVGRQIAFLIATGQVKPGVALPSVRALANRLKIHHNTVSQAYQDLVDYHLIERRRGSRMIVPVPGKWPPQSGTPDLDDVINAAIHVAQEHGFTLQQLRKRVQERLLAQPPDHILIVEEEVGIRQLLLEELREHLDCPIEACARSEIAANPGRAIGALVVGPPGTMRATSSLLPKDRPPFPITFNSAAREVALVRKLREPSTIAVVSVSELFLQTARGLLAPALGNIHTLREFFLPSEKPDALGTFALVFCDSVTRRKVKSKKLVHYGLISPNSLGQIARMMNPS
jgi:DNA-binding transcriptional regulator YhcF (GntR family)